MPVDLNCDLGEAFGAYQMGSDSDVIAQVTSVNVACGLHAGDPLIMQETVLEAKKNGVAVGAHPGFPDLQGFGRRRMYLSPAEVEAYVLYQVGALSAFLQAAGLRLQHVKPHGALYHMAALDFELALAIGQAIARFDSSVIYCGMAGSEMQKAAAELGLRFAGEAFAERTYGADGLLVPRGHPGAVIENAAEAARRAVRMAKEGLVKAVDGSDVRVCADTICLHGDNAHAVAVARQVRSFLEAAEVELLPMEQIVAHRPAAGSPSLG